MTEPGSTPPLPPPEQAGHSPIPPAGSRRAGIAALSGRQIVALMIAAVAGVFGVIVAAGSLGFSAESTDVDFGLVFLAGLAIQPLVFLGLTYLLVIRRWGLDWRDIGLVPAGRAWLWRAPLIWVGCLPVIAALKWLSDTTLGTPESNPYAETFDALGAITPGLGAAIVLLGGIVIPFAEEVVFRGVLYPWLRSRMRVPAAVALSATVFSLLHMHEAILLPIFFLGIVMAYLREWSGSLWPPVLFHGLHNSVMFVVLFAAEAVNEAAIRAV